MYVTLYNLPLETLVFQSRLTGEEQGRDHTEERGK
jgi:hypothetical protein